MIRGLLIWVLFAAGTPAAADGSLTPAALRAELDRPIPAYFVSGPEGAEMWARISEFYALRHDQPLWRTARGPSRLPQLANWLALSRSHGLDPEDYHRSRLEEAFGSPPVSVSSPVLRSVWEAEQEVLITHSVWRLAADLARGRVDPREGSWSLRRRPLPPADRLAAALDAGDFEAWLDGLAPQHRQYRLLQRILAEYRDRAVAGGWPAFPADGPLLTRGSRHADVPALQRLLVGTGDLAREDATPGFGPKLEAAVRRFQSRHALDQDGVVGPAFRAAAQPTAADRVRQIELSLERWRWLPRSLGDRYLLVNVAAARLAAVSGGREVLAMKTIVGEPEHPTRLFSHRVEKVVLWPPWNVPRGLAHRKVLPRARSEPGYLSRDGFEVFTLDWRRVDPEGIDWRRVDESALPYRFRQKAGSRNALGQLTLEFPNSYNIYIHDTPERHLFAKQERLFSAGCIRVARPRELAALVLGDGWEESDVIRALGPGRTRELAVTDDWAIHIVYFRAWVDGEERAGFAADPYGLDGELVDLLASRFRPL